MLFGPAPVTLDRLISTVGINFPFHVGRADQTAAIGRALDVLGLSLNCEVFAGDPANHRRDREWLLHLVWWERGRGTVLAAICAWGSAGLVGDGFHKLLATKSPLKLLVCSTRQAGAERQDAAVRTDIDAVLRVLGTYAIDFRQHVRGEHYLLLDLVQEENLFRAYEWCAPADGKLDLPFDQASTLFRPVAPQVSVAA